MYLRELRRRSLRDAQEGHGMNPHDDPHLKRGQAMRVLLCKSLTGPRLNRRQQRRASAAASLALLCACQPASTSMPSSTPTTPAPSSSSSSPAATAPAPTHPSIPPPTTTAPAPAPPAAPAGWTIGYARRDLTPGVRNPAVTQATIGSTICVRGWTATIRPPVSYTNKLKATGIIAYGYANTDPASVEEDHNLPLEGGGSPTDPRNLWPQPRYGPVNAAQKDADENALRASICSGAQTLDAAQTAFLATWVR